MADRTDLRFTLTRLPNELIYLYLVAPIVAAPVLTPGFLRLSPQKMLWQVLGGYIPFLAIPAACHALYRFVMPSLVLRVRSLLARLILHATMSALATVLVCLAIRPLHQACVGYDQPLVAFLATSVIITWTFLLPTLVVLELRAHAEVAQAARQQLLEEQKIALRAQLEAIQSRTNPHFLFNALNTIASLIRDDPELAEKTVERLSDLLRHALQSARVETVPLAREVETLKDYLEIQRARFGARLRYTIEVEPGLETLKLPPFVLQPLVENAILHGIAGRPEGGLVEISARQRPGRVELRVQDDGPGPAGSTHRGSGTGLQDLSRRLELLYGSADLLLTRVSDAGGFTVELRLPDEVPGRDGAADDDGERARGT